MLGPNKSAMTQNTEIEVPTIPPLDSFITVAATLSVLAVNITSVQLPGIFFSCRYKLAMLL